MTRAERREEAYCDTIDERYDALKADGWHEATDTFRMRIRTGAESLPEWLAKVPDLEPVVTDGGNSVEFWLTLRDVRYLNNEYCTDEEVLADLLDPFSGQLHDAVCKQYDIIDEYDIIEADWI